ncbi:MAG TPA: signal peptidase II [Polyangiaceae bacterium]|nr:signal peptidase II [Polyangiaceae bacterium]
MRPCLRFMLVLLMVWLLVGCDHVSKHLARNNLADGSVVPVAGSAFDLRYVENRDVAFNLLRWVPPGTRTPLILAIGACGVLALGGLLFARRAGGRTQTVALSLLLAGALGNLIDRAWHGYVVDFLHVPHWPVFNVADVYVTIGVAALVLFGRTLSQPRAAPP